MPLRGVIFDLDGTLVDSALDFDAIRREMELPQGVPILEALAEISPGTRLDECLRILHRHEREGSLRATVMPGARELLDRLRARGLEQGLLTRNSRASTELVLDRLGLSFSCVLTREDARPKPDPAGLLAICAAWHAAPDEVLFVGDYLHDLNCGRQAGIRTVLFCPETRPYYAHLADHCIADLAEIDALLGPPKLT